MRVGRRCGMTYRQIETLGGQQYEPVGHLESNATLRTRSQKIGQPHNELLPRERNGGGDAHKSAWDVRRLLNLREADGNRGILTARAVDQVLPRFH